MVKEVIWLKRSSENFQKVIEYLNNEWSDEAADDFYYRTQAVIKIIQEHPNSGKIIQQRENVSQFLITKHNYLVYKIFKDKLIIVNIFDTRQKRTNKIG